MSNDNRTDPQNDSGRYDSSSVPAVRIVLLTSVILIAVFLIGTAV